MEYLTALIRHFLSAAGGILTARGLATQSDVEELGGAIALVISMGWSIWRKWKRAKEQQSAQAATIKPNG